MLPLLAWLAVFGLFSAPGDAAQLRTHGGNEARGFAFDYTSHGQDWLQGSCSSRIRQSPIDFAASLGSQVPTESFKFAYDRVTGPIKMSNTGHTLSVDVGNKGYGGANFADAWYQLMYINIHALSEHTFGGMHQPAELHLVHKRYDSDALLVIAIPVGCSTPPPQGGNPLPVGGPYEAPSVLDPNFNPMLQLLLKVAPPPVMMQVQIPGDEVAGPDLSMLLSGSRFFGYAGSTTAPPCDESVMWLVRSEPVLASDTQVRYLYDAIFANTGGNGNYRATMPLSGRSVLLYEGNKELAPSIPYTPTITSGSMQTDRQYRAMKWAKDALKIATASLDYIRNLDQRLHGAAQASSAAVNPVPGLSASPSPAIMSPVNGAPAPAYGAPAPSYGVLAPGRGAPAPGYASASLAPAPGVLAAAAPGAPTAADKAAVAMAAMVAQAAKEAVKNATAQIAAEANATAIEVARAAANMVLQGMTGDAGHPQL